MTWKSDTRGRLHIHGALREFPHPWKVQVQCKKLLADPGLENSRRTVTCQGTDRMLASPKPCAEKATSAAQAALSEFSAKE